MAQRGELTTLEGPVEESRRKPANQSVRGRLPLELYREMMGWFGANADRWRYGWGTRRRKIGVENVVGVMAYHWLHVLTEGQRTALMDELLPKVEELDRIDTEARNAAMAKMAEMKSSAYRLTQGQRPDMPKGSRRGRA